ncbi:MAG: hypothetical protein HQK57_06950, partial [Deltaproteobacteria bacterium]|nr:hypothetical protein [Deltaproteobacteria bacterium]
MELDGIQKRIEAMKSHLTEDSPLMGNPGEAKIDRQVEKAVEASHKAVVATEKEIGEDADKPKGPVGLDIG